MLVLSRKPGEKIVLSGGITVTVVQVKGQQVRLAFEAPDPVRILRGELSCWQEERIGSDDEGESVVPCEE